MKSIRNAIAKRRTGRRLSKLWKDYQAVAQIGDDSEMREKLQTFLDTFQTMYSENVVSGEGGGMSLVVDGQQQELSELLTGLLDAVDREVVTTQGVSSQQGQGQSSLSSARLHSLAQLADKAIAVAEVIVKDEKYRDFVQSSPEALSRVLSLLERTDSTANRVRLLRLLVSLGRTRQDKVAVGRMDGFRKMLHLLLSGNDTLTKEISKALQHFMDVPVEEGMAIAASGSVSGQTGPQPPSAGGDIPRAVWGVSRVVVGTLQQVLSRMTLGSVPEDKAIGNKDEISVPQGSFPPSAKEVGNTLEATQLARDVKADQTPTADVSTADEVSDCDSSVACDASDAVLDNGEGEGGSEGDNKQDQNLIKEFMRVQGVLRSLTQTLKQAASDVQLDLLKTLATLLQGSSALQEEFKSMNGYDILSQLMVSMQSPNPEAGVFLDDAFRILLTVARDGRVGGIIGNMDALELLVQMAVQEHNAIPVRRRAAAALLELIEAYPLNAAVLEGMSLLPQLFSSLLLLPTISDQQPSDEQSLPPEYLEGERESLLRILSDLCLLVSFVFSRHSATGVIHMCNACERHWSQAAPDCKWVSAQSIQVCLLLVIEQNTPPPSGQTAQQLCSLLEATTKQPWTRELSSQALTGTLRCLVNSVALIAQPSFALPKSLVESRVFEVLSDACHYHDESTLSNAAVGLQMIAFQAASTAAQSGCQDDIEHAKAAANCAVNAIRGDSLPPSLRIVCLTSVDRVAALLDEVSAAYIWSSTLFAAGLGDRLLAVLEGCGPQVSATAVKCVLSVLALGGPEVLDYWTVRNGWEALSGAFAQGSVAPYMEDSLAMVWVRCASQSNDVFSSAGMRFGTLQHDAGWQSRVEAIKHRGIRAWLQWQRPPQTLCTGSVWPPMPPRSITSGQAQSPAVAASSHGSGSQDHAQHFSATVPQIATEQGFLGVPLSRTSSALSVSDSGYSDRRTEGDGDTSVPPASIPADWESHTEFVSDESQGGIVPRLVSVACLQSLLYTSLLGQGSATALLAIKSSCESSPSSCQVALAAGAVGSLCSKMTRETQSLSEEVLHIATGLLGCLLHHSCSSDNFELLLQNATDSSLSSFSRQIIMSALHSAALKQGPAEYFFFDGSDNRIRLPPIERFPPSKVGYSLQLSLQVDTWKGDETPLVRWIDVSGASTVEAVFLRLGAPAEHRCLALRSSKQDSFSLNVFSTWVAPADGHWRDVMLVHGKGTATLYVDGAFVQSMAFPTYPSGRPVVGILGGGAPGAGAMVGSLANCVVCEGMLSADKVAMGTPRRKVVIQVSPSNSAQAPVDASQSASSSSSNASALALFNAPQQRLCTSEASVGHAAAPPMQVDVPLPSPPKSGGRSSLLDSAGRKRSTSKEVPSIVTLEGRTQAHCTQPLAEAVGSAQQLIPIIRQVREGGLIAVASMRSLAAILGAAAPSLVDNLEDRFGHCVLLAAASQCCAIAQHETDDEAIWEALSDCASLCQTDGGRRAFRWSQGVRVFAHCIPLLGSDAQRPALRALQDILSGGTAVQGKWNGSDGLGTVRSLWLVQEVCDNARRAALDLVSSTARSWTFDDVYTALAWAVGGQCGADEITGHFVELWVRGEAQKSTCSGELPALFLAMMHRPSDRIRAMAIRGLGLCHEHNLLHFSPSYKGIWQAVGDILARGSGPGPCACEELLSLSVLQPSSTISAESTSNLDGAGVVLDAHQRANAFDALMRALCAESLSEELFASVMTRIASAVGGSGEALATSSPSQANLGVLATALSPATWILAEGCLKSLRMCWHSVKHTEESQKAVERQAVALVLHDMQTSKSCRLSEDCPWDCEFFVIVANQVFSHVERVSGILEVSVAPGYGAALSSMMEALLVGFYHNVNIADVQRARCSAIQCVSALNSRNPPAVRACFKEERLFSMRDSLVRGLLESSAMDSTGSAASVLFNTFSVDWLSQQPAVQARLPLATIAAMLALIRSAVCSSDHSGLSNAILVCQTEVEGIVALAERVDGAEVKAVLASKALSQSPLATTLLGKDFSAAHSSLLSAVRECLVEFSRLSPDGVKAALNQLQEAFLAVKKCKSSTEQPKRDKKCKANYDRFFKAEESVSKQSAACFDMSLEAISRCEGRLEELIKELSKADMEDAAKGREMFTGDFE